MKHRVAVMGVSMLMGWAVSAKADDGTWVRVATQTCIEQAPNDPYVSKLNLSASRLRSSCRCMARDMLKVISYSEREQLLVRMQDKRSIRSQAQQLFARQAVKNAALACSAASLWD